MNINWEMFLSDLKYPAERISELRREITEEVGGVRWGKVPYDVEDALKELREAVKKFDKIVQERIL